MTSRGFDGDLPTSFVVHAADVLGDTSAGLTGAQIVRLMRGYAAEYGKEIPHAVSPNDAPNKRTALYENLLPFSGPQKHRILRELADCSGFTTKSPERQKLKIALATKYKELDSEIGASTVNEALIQETRHWLDACPPSLAIYNDAIGKYRTGLFQRNVLDDLRLALETLLKSILENERSLEHQLPGLGQFIKARGGSPEVVNMFSKLMEYYCRYQNTYVRHADAVIEQEVEFVLEITSSFMKHIIRMHAHLP
jgi:hypothetical protein